MKVAVIILAVVAILAAAVAGFAVWKMDSGVKVPDVVGQKAADATTALSDAGLAYSVQHAYSDDVDQRTIDKEQPSAGSSVAKGSMVVVWVSDGPSKASVPDVVGQTVAQADTALTALGLNIRQVAGASANVQKGQVFKSAPTSGTEVPRGSIINVYYNNQRPTVVVPALEGLTEAQAADRLKTKGLYLGSVGTQTSTSVAQGAVMSQSVPATEQVARGTKVSVVLSSGPPEPVIPDVLNMPYVQAQDKLTALGFQVRTSWTPGSGMSPGAVIKVVPSVGTPAPEGSLIHIYVEEGSGPYM